MTKEEKLQMEKQGNLKDHYFAQMLFEGQKRLQKFAP